MKIPSRVRRVDITQRTDSDSGNAEAFLTTQRLEIVNTYTNGEKSPAYMYDTVLRKWLDAVVMLLTAEVDGLPVVCLRSGVRPPLLLRRELEIPIPDKRIFHTLWELPAGLIENDEHGPEGIRKRAAIETLEETGYRLSEDDFEILTGAPFLSPGIIPERLYFALGRVEDIADRITPTGDGSPAEDGSGLWWIGIDDALALCEQGELVDTKTELGLWRLKARLRSQESSE
ncbi:MAG: NUDIX domain-containing protein [Deltaproteobacteria bacterium]|nr:NUDIX domain-containing protein [Deltaproteobacteria bacterium]